MNSQRTNTFLLVILIILVLVGIIMLAKRDHVDRQQIMPPVSEESEQAPATSQQNPTQPTSLAPSVTTTRTEYGVSITTPNTTQFEKFSNTTGASIGNKGFVISNNSKESINVTIFPSQARLNEDMPQGVGSDWTLVNANYRFAGSPARLYSSTFGKLILVPSKLAWIEVMNPSVSGLSQSVTDQMLASISFN